MYVSQADWSLAAQILMHDIRYSNFKNVAAANEQVVGTDYVDALHDVWGRMYDLQVGTYAKPAARKRKKRQGG
jgi:hypothetical protein